MVAKAKSCMGGGALFNYVVNDLKGFELLRNNVSGMTSREMFTDMEILQQQNLRCKNNTISIVLSPTIDDGKNKSDNQLKLLTKAFLKEMNLDPKNNQFIAFVHTEKEHKHVHILLNRIRTDGSLIKDNHIGLKAQSAAHEVAMKMGWVSAKNIKIQNQRIEKKSNLEIKKMIKATHFNVMRNKPASLKEYMNQMSKQGVTVLPSITKQGNIQGFRFIHEATKTNLKASEIDRKLGLNDLFSNHDVYLSKKTKSSEHFADFKLNTNTFNLLSRTLNSLGYLDFSNYHVETNRKKRKKNQGTKR